MPLSFAANVSAMATARMISDIAIDARRRELAGAMAERSAVPFSPRGVWEV